MENVKYNNSDESYNMIVNQIISQSKENLIKDNDLMGACYIIVNNLTNNVFEMALVPVIVINKDSPAINAAIIKELLEEFKNNFSKDAKTVRKIKTVITVVQGSILTMEKKDVNFSVDGRITNKIGKISENPNSKKVLIFTIEEEFIVKSLIYETLEVDENTIMINDKPMIDIKNAYDSRVANNSSMGYLFTKGSSNN